MFVEGGLELLTTRFMERLKQVVSEEDFQSINKEIHKTLKGEMDEFCNQKYCSLTEAKDKLYPLLTEILREEAGNVIDHDIPMLNHEKGEIKTKMSQIEYNTNRANSKKASRDSLLKEFDIAKKELIKLTQDERKQESTGDKDKDKVKTDTAARVLLHLD